MLTWKNKNVIQIILITPKFSPPSLDQTVDIGGGILEYLIRIEHSPGGVSLGSSRRADSSRALAPQSATWRSHQFRSDKD